MEDHSIVAGFGCHQGLEEDESPLDLAGPQATSTVAAKITREGLNRQYLQSLQEASEGSLEEFRSLRSTLKGESQGSSGMGMMMALPLIDTETMSGLSSSNFLVDHNQFRVEAIQDQLKEQLQEENRSVNVPCEEKDLDLIQRGLKELPSDPAETEINEDLAGLPSALLEPQGFLLDQDQQNVEDEGIRDITALTGHLARTELDHDEFSVSQVEFDASQISASSTIHEGSHRAIEASKLLSNSCSSLGCIDGPSDAFLNEQPQVGAMDEDWLEDHQEELAHVMEGEEFHSPDLMFFEEEERQHREENRFDIDAAQHSSKHHLDFSCFSGIHGVMEITVRPSWIDSPEKELVGPNNRMLVDDYLQARSEALGSLNTTKNPSNRPNFGKEVHSPPNPSKTQSFDDSSTAEESSGFSASEMSIGQDSRVTSAVTGSGYGQGFKENTLKSQERPASTTVTLSKDEKQEQMSGMEVVHEIEELEASSHTVRRPLEASTINSLLTRAMETNSPHDLVDRILKLTQEPGQSSTLETTGLDASLDVMELRRMKEDLFREKQKGLKSSHCPGKENRSKEERNNPACIPNRKPLQSVAQPGQHPVLPLSNKHTKLKAVRTNSAPPIHQASHNKDECEPEETLQEVQYMSKLGLPSLTNGGTVKSTHCIPHTQIPLPDSTEEPLVPSTNNQRVLPRMGLRSSSKGSVKKPDVGVSSGTDGVSVPQCLMVPEACVVGMATYTTIPLHNPSSRWLQVSLSLIKESLDGNASRASVLLFQPSHCLEPQGRCDVRLGVCCPVQGQFKALLQVQVGELTTSGTRDSNPSTHTIEISATVVMPEVEVLCEGDSEGVDFGVLAESCCLSQTITLISHSPQPLPLLLQLHHVAGKTPIFSWESNKNRIGKVVSASHLSCELTPSTPTTFSLTLRAPHLDELSVSQDMKIQVESLLSVLLDSPAPTRITLASHPIKAAIGVVQLQILRTPEPLVIDANPHQSGTTNITLKNASSFPLHISLSVKDNLEVFSLRPSTLTIMPGARSSPALFFIPGTQQGTISSILVIRVEPDGMEFKIPVSGICHATSQTPSTVSMSDSTPTCGKPLHTSASSVAPVTAPGTVSASLTARPPQPAHQLVHKIHGSLTKSTSAPLSEVTSSIPPLNEKTLSSALESTKSRLVFGTVAVGATSSQKLVLRNNLTNQKLPLCITIIGSQAFQVCEYGSENGQEKLEVMLKPHEDFVLSVLLRPSNVEALSATLICRHRSSSNPFKWKIPLQGYGGRGALLVKDNLVGKPFILKDLSLGLPSILQTCVTNTGDRTLFLALQVFSDKHCKEPAADLSVQPTRLVLGVGETHEVYVVANGTPRQLAKTPGLIGVLQVVSGEEILRQRYLRMKNKNVKARHINNPGLLKLNWMEEFNGKHEDQVETDILPPQAEDAVVFFNGCTITQVEVWGEQRHNDDHSSTVFACLAGEQTVADLTTTHIERVDSPCLSQPSSAASWDVLPQTMSVQCGDISPQIFFIVNFTSTQQMLEVSSSCKWLEIEPREAVLQGHSSVKLCVTACPPHPLTAPVHHSLKVMGENESRSATITILPAPKEAPKTNLKSSQSVQVSVSAKTLHPTLDKAVPPLTNICHPNTATTTVLSSGNVSQASLHQPVFTPNTNSDHIQDPSPPDSQPQVPGKRSDSKRESQKGLVQLVSDDLSYPDTRVTQETCVRVMLRNLDKIIHSVQAEIKQGPFMVRHTHFTIKPGHYVSVPVYFKPQKTGLCTGCLQLTVLKEKLLLPVYLSGQALS